MWLIFRGVFFAVFDRFYKDYGAFSTHAPVYNSKGAAFTKEEVDMLRSAYGSERGIAYAERYFFSHFFLYWNQNDC